MNIKKQSSFRSKFKGYLVASGIGIILITILIFVIPSLQNLPPVFIFLGGLMLTGILETIGSFISDNIIKLIQSLLREEQQKNQDLAFLREKSEKLQEAFDQMENLRDLVEELSQNIESFDERLRFQNPDNLTNAIILYQKIMAIDENSRVIISNDEAEDRKSMLESASKLVEAYTGKETITGHPVRRIFLTPDRFDDNNHEGEDTTIRGLAKE